MSLRTRWGTASEPARQLNSRTIKDAARCYIAPIVQNGFAIITAKCVWRVAGGQPGLYQAWDMICEKRNECNRAVENVRNVGFYFSAIAVFDEKGNKPSKDVDHDEEAQANTSTEPASSQSSSARESVVKTKRYPAITYWIAVASPSGMPIQDLGLRKTLLKCNVEIDAKTISCRRGSEEKCIGSLFTVLKDHSSSYMQLLVNESCQRCFEQTYVDVTDNEPTTSQVSEFSNVEKVVKFTMISRPSKEVRTMLQALRRSGLEFDIVGIPVENTEADEMHVPYGAISNDPYIVLIYEIEKIMKKLNFALYRGQVYRLVPGARFTYEMKCDVAKFIGTLEGNSALKHKIIKYGKRVVNKLSDPTSQAIRQIIVDYNLIEISGGRCLSLRDRRILNDQIKAEQIGAVTPRAFSPYEGNMDNCEAKYFQDALQNSLSPDNIRSFCADFLHLLDHRGKTHKEKVPFLIGESNSGKTSLFCPIQGVVHPKHIAKITKQREFNKAMINQDCEVIFLDEARVGMMDIDDWKILTQGGWTAHDEKYKTCQGFVNKCPMLMASQTDLYFGNKADNDAMNVRLRRYNFKKLPSVEPGAFDWLREHPVDCIIWAMNRSTDRVRVGQDRLQEQEKGILTVVEERELLDVNVRALIESDDDNSEEEASHEDRPPVVAIDGTDSPPSSQPSDAEVRVQEELGRCYETSLRFQHLSKMKNKMREERQGRLTEFKERKIQEKLLTPEECEEIDDPNNIPEYIKKRMLERSRILMSNRQRNFEKQAKTMQDMEAAFANSWLLTTERGILENQEKYETSDPSLYKALREIAVNKLMLYHTSKSYDDDSKLALEKRIKMIEGLGYRAIVTDLWSAPIILNKITQPTACEDSGTDPDDLSGLTQTSPQRNLHSNKRKAPTRRRDQAPAKRFSSQPTRSSTENVTRRNNSTIAQSQPIRLRGGPKRKTQRTLDEYFMSK